jgi:hypothetical protein
LPLKLEMSRPLRHIPAMVQRDYRYRLRKYPRGLGIVWRWFIYDGPTGRTLESGVVTEPDRGKAETAASEAIARLRRNAEQVPHLASAPLTSN